MASLRSRVWRCQPYAVCLARLAVGGADASALDSTGPTRGDAVGSISPKAMRSCSFRRSMRAESPNGGIMSETTEDDAIEAAAVRAQREQAIIAALEGIRAELHTLPSRIVWLYVAVMIWIWIIGGVILGLMISR